MINSRFVLKEGDVLRSVLGIEIRVERLLGSNGGRHGYVYRVNYGGTPKILKWYKEAYLDTLEDRERFYHNLYHNVKNRPDGITKVFGWPSDLTDWSPNTDNVFGYIVDEIDTTSYKRLTDYFMFTARFESSHAMLTCCINIIEACRQLHFRGLCWNPAAKDIYTNPDTGRIYIAYNNNIVANGMKLNEIGNVRYTAPESILGKISDKYSDRYSLAIILFRIMMGGQHPLEGVYSESNDEKVVYVKDPVFIFDDNDKRNAPTTLKHKNAMTMWAQYPDYIKDMFKKVFRVQVEQKENEVAILNRENRPSEEEWKRTIIRLQGDM